jgi:hypothetical protein
MTNVDVVMGFYGKVDPDEALRFCRMMIVGVELSPK